MRKLLNGVILLFAALFFMPQAGAQIVTPNLKLQLPPRGTFNWDSIVNQNFTVLDTFAGTAQALYQGVWSAAAVYSKGQFAQSSGILYMSLLSTNLNNAPATSPFAWQVVLAPGTVTSVSAGGLTPLFTTGVSNTATTPAISFTLSNAAAHTYFGNNSGSTGAPAFFNIALLDLPGSGAVTVNTTAPLGGGGSVNLGGTLTLTCTGCLTSGNIFVADAGVGTRTLIASFSRTGAAVSTTERYIGFTFSDGNNTSVIAGYGGVRNNSNTDFNGSAIFWACNSGGITPCSTINDLTEVGRINNLGTMSVKGFTTVPGSLPGTVGDGLVGRSATAGYIFYGTDSAKAIGRAANDLDLFGFTGILFGSNTSGNVLRANGTHFIAATLAAADLSNGVTGSGAVVLGTSPTNLTLDAEGTGNVITIPIKIWLPAAGCNNATASTFWDLPTSTPAAPACVTGTNTQKGVLAYADTAGGFSAQTTELLPSDWSGNIDARIIWFTPATGGNAKWSLSTICTSVSATATDDPAFNTASTVTTAAPTGAANQIQTSSISAITVTGCSAGQLLHIKLFRDGNDAADTIANTAQFYGLELTLRRAM